VRRRRRRGAHRPGLHGRPPTGSRVRPPPSTPRSRSPTAIVPDQFPPLRANTFPSTKDSLPTAAHRSTHADPAATAARAHRATSRITARLHRSHAALSYPSTRLDATSCGGPRTSTSRSRLDATSRGGPADLYLEIADHRVGEVRQLRRLDHHAAQAGQSDDLSDPVAPQIGTAQVRVVERDLPQPASL
jgi:hypothetical protein